MTWFADLSRYCYLLPSDALNVGWLDAEHPFPTGAVPPELLPRLEQLVAYARTGFTMGPHTCQFCPGQTSNEQHRDSAEIRAVGRDGRRYAAPCMIRHYIAVHQYRPPDEFIEAVLRDDRPDWPPSKVTYLCERCDSTLTSGRCPGCYVGNPRMLPVSMYRTAQGLQIAIAREAAERDEDRAGAFTGAARTLLALADGAGGSSHGARAAQAWLDVVEQSLDAEVSWPALVEQLDADEHRRGPGKTTAIVVEITATELRGACAGDSAAWLVLDQDVIDLTEHAPPKPLVGDGCIATEIVTRPFTRGTLLVASDGIVKYASRARIAEVVRIEDLETAALSLLELVRLSSGKLPDDAIVIVCRR